MPDAKKETTGAIPNVDSILESIVGQIEKAEKHYETAIPDIAQRLNNLAERLDHLPKANREVSTQEATSLTPPSETLRKLRDQAARLAEKVEKSDLFAPETSAKTGVSAPSATSSESEDTSVTMPSDPEGADTSLFQGSPDAKHAETVPAEQKADTPVSKSTETDTESPTLDGPSLFEKNLSEAGLLPTGETPPLSMPSGEPSQKSQRQEKHKRTVSSSENRGKLEIQFAGRWRRADGKAEKHSEIGASPIQSPHEPSAGEPESKKEMGVATSDGATSATSHDEEVFSAGSGKINATVKSSNLPLEEPPVLRRSTKTLDQAPQSTVATPPTKRLVALEQQVAKLARQVEEAVSATHVDGAIQAIQERLDKLTQTLSALDARQSGLAESAPAGESGISPQLMGQLEELSQKWEEAEAQFARISAIEEKLGAIMGLVERSEARAVAAAGRAAEEVATRIAMETVKAHAAPAEHLAEIQADLRAMEDRARETDARTADRLEVMHEALKQIAQRLEAMESPTRQEAQESASNHLLSTKQPAETAQSPQGASSSISPSARQSIPDQTIASPAEPPVSEASPGSAPPEDMSTASTISSEIDKKGGAESPVSLEDTAEAAAERDRAEKADTPPAKNHPQADFLAKARQAARNANQTVEQKEKTGKTFLGLGGGKREKNASSEPSAQDPLQEDFIAAARRAAQAAREQANTTPGSAVSPSAKDNGKGAGKAVKPPKKKGKSLFSSGSKRPSPLLVGAAILLLLFSAIMLFAQLRASQKQKQAATSATTSSLPLPPRPEGTESVVPSPGVANSPNPRVAAQPVTETRRGGPVVRQTVLPPSKRQGPQVIGPAPFLISEQLTENAEKSRPATAPSVPPKTVAYRLEDRPGQTRVTRDKGNPAGALGQAKIQKRRLPLPPATIGPLSLRLAAARGVAEAQFEVGRRFHEGKGVRRNYQKAALWYRRAAAQGHAPAQYRLATLYERGRGVTKDLARALVWYRRSAEAGNVKAMHNLAVIYTGNRLQQPDYAQAAQWFHKAAAHGLADSQFNLAILYQNGLGVKRSLTQAYKWFALAARQGDKEAAKARDLLTYRLTQPELTKARRLVAAWRPMPADRLANSQRGNARLWQRTAAGSPSVTR